MRSIHCLVGPPGATDWHVDLDRFVTALSTLWPTADIALSGPEAPERFPSVTWSVRNWRDEEEVPPWLDGSLDRARQTSSLRGDIELVTRYVLWFRKLDPQQPLALIADNDRGTLALLPTTTEEEVTDFLQ